MPQRRRTLWAAVIASMLLTAALWWSAVADGGASGSSASYAVLSVPRDADETEIVSALARVGIDDIVCESNEWVAINDFGDWEKVPLNSFRSRIEPFDPRDDGYADRVRTLFVTESTRFLYLRKPVSLLGGSSDGAFSTSVAKAMGKKKYELSIGVSGDRSILPMVLMLLAAAAAIAFSRSFAAAAAVPSLLALSFFGAGGLVSAGFLCAASIAVFRLASEASRGPASSWLRDLAVPAAALCLASFAASLAGALPLLVSVLSILSSVSLSASAALCLAELERLRGHERFQPVGILADLKSGLASFSSMMVPFAVAACLLSIGYAWFVLPSGGSAGPDTLAKAKISVSLDDYTAHLERQRTFLTSRVMDADAKKGYILFSVGSDGFAAVSDQSAKIMPPPRLELPPAERFLADAGAFGSRAGRAGAPSKSSFDILRTLLVLAIACAACLPALRAYGSKRRQSKAAQAVADKRIAA